MVGDTLWVHDIVGSDSLFTSRSMAIGQDGAIYYAKSGGTLYWTAARIVAIDKNSGNQIWESEPIDHIDLSSNIVVGEDGTVYVIGYYKLYAFNHTNGNLKWVWEVPSELPNPDGPGSVYTYGQIGGLALLNDGSLILGSVGSGIYNRALYAVSVDGITKWHNIGAVSGSIGSGIYVGVNNRVHYFSSINGKNAVFSVDGNTGNILWTKEIDTYIRASNNILIDNFGNVIVSVRMNIGEGVYLYKLDQNSGDIIWKSVSESSGYPKLLASNGVIYEYDYQNGIMMFDATTGNAVLFSNDVKADLSACVINSSNQLVIVNYYDSHINVSTCNADGNLDWSTIFDGLKNHSLMISQNEVIIGSTSNKIVAIQGDSKMNGSGCPRIGLDNRNTNNINK